MHPRIRPQKLEGVTVSIPTSCGTLYVTVNHDLKGICEVFMRIGKSGGCTSSHMEALGRMVSIALRANVSLDDVIGQLTGLRCSSPTHLDGKQILSCSDAVAQALIVARDDLKLKIGSDTSSDIKKEVEETKEEPKK